MEVGMICLIDGSFPLGLHVIWVFRTKDGRNEFFYAVYRREKLSSLDF